MHIFIAFNGKIQQQQELMHLEVIRKLLSMATVTTTVISFNALL